MEWLEIVLNHLPTLVGLVGAGTGVYFWREKKDLERKEVELKGSQVAQANVETQRQEIDLGKTFMRESLEMQKTMQSMLQANNADTAAIASELAAVKTRMGDLEGTMEKKMTTLNRSLSGTNNRLGMVEKYLNGQYKEYKEKEAESKKKK